MSIRFPHPARVLAAGLTITLLTVGLCVWGEVDFWTPPGNVGELVTGEWVEVTGRVHAMEMRYKGWNAVLTEVAVEGVSGRGRVLLRLSPFTEVQVGDVVQTGCALGRPEPFDGFAYEKFLAARHVYAVCSPRFVEVESTVMGWRRVVHQFHVIARGAMGNILPEPHATLLAGLLMGDDHFSPEWGDTFRRVGLSHVVAASGSNISMVINLLLPLFFAFSLPRSQATKALFVLLFLYAVLTGAEPAIVRAMIMGSLALFARDLGRATTATNIFLLTLTVMVLESPLRLRYDPGFQLSALATAGMLYVAGPLEERLWWVPERFGLRGILSQSLAATLTTLPVTVFSFHTFSVVAIVANLLVLPLLPFAMIAGAVAAIVSLLLPFASAIVGIPARLILELALTLSRELSLLPFASLKL